MPKTLSTVVFAVCLAVSCGPDLPGEAADLTGEAPAAAREALAAPSVAAPAASRPVPLEEAVVGRARRVPGGALAGVPLHLTGLGGHEGQVVHVLSGMLGCGFAETGRGQGVVSGGEASITLTRSEGDLGYESLFVFVDGDGDGACTVSESGETSEPVFRTALPAAGAVVTVDLSSVSPSSSWECTLFNQP